MFVATAAGNPEEASLKPGLYGDVGGRRGSAMAAVQFRPHDGKSHLESNRNIYDGTLAARSGGK